VGFKPTVGFVCFAGKKGQPAGFIRPWEKIRQNQKNRMLLLFIKWVIGFVVEFQNIYRRKLLEADKTTATGICQV
jgi:hypothetical protein